MSNYNVSSAASTGRPPGSDGPKRAWGVGAAFTGRNLWVTFTVAVTAALYAGVASLVDLPTWAMFLGWNIAALRGATLREGGWGIAGVASGMALGMGSNLALGWLSSEPSTSLQMVMTFAVGSIVLSARFVPHMSNVASIFLGLTAYSASGLAPGLQAFFTLSAGCALGCLAAWTARRLQSLPWPLPAPALQEEPLTNR